MIATTTPRRTIAFCTTLLMAIFLATTTSASEEIHFSKLYRLRAGGKECSQYNKKRGCQRNGCVYIKIGRRKANPKCRDMPTEKKCAGRDTKKRCQRIGCLWDKATVTCSSPAIANEETQDDEEEEDGPLVLGQSDAASREKPAVPIGVSEFLDSLIEMDGEAAIDAVNQAAGTVLGPIDYHAYICGKPDSDMQCNLRNKDRGRIKLFTDDDDNTVASYTVG